MGHKARMHGESVRYHRQDHAVRCMTHKLALRKVLSCAARFAPALLSDMETARHRGVRTKVK